MAETKDPVQVEIFGQTYAVRGGMDPDYVAELATLVDSQMREISRSAGAVDTVRIAVLAALNIAADCQRLKAQLGHLERRMQAASESLAKVVDRKGVSQ